MSKVKDGAHTISDAITPQLTSLQVSCNQETDGGGGIMYIYQRRVDGTEHFTRNWEEYKHMITAKARRNVVGT